MLALRECAAAHNRASAHAGAAFEFDHLGVERITYCITLMGEVPVEVAGCTSRVVAGEAFKGPKG